MPFGASALNILRMKWAMAAPRIPDGSGCPVFPVLILPVFSFAP
jgi:hypothetical protein